MLQIEFKACSKCSKVSKCLFLYLIRSLVNFRLLRWHIHRRYCKNVFLAYIKTWFSSLCQISPILKPPGIILIQPLEHFWSPNLFIDINNVKQLSFSNTLEIIHKKCICLALRQLVTHKNSALTGYNSKSAQSNKKLNMFDNIVKYLLICENPYLSLAYALLFSSVLIRLFFFEVEL